MSEDPPPEDATRVDRLRGDSDDRLQARRALEEREYDRLYEPYRVAAAVLRAASSLISARGWLSFKSSWPTDGIEAHGLGSWTYFELEQSPDARRRTSHFTLRGAVYVALSEADLAAVQERQIIALGRARDLVGMALACQLSIEIGREIPNYSDSRGWEDAAEDWNNSPGRKESEIVDLLTRAAASLEVVLRRA